MISNSGSSLWSAFLCVPSQALSPPSLLLLYHTFPPGAQGLEQQQGTKLQVPDVCLRLKYLARSTIRWASEVRIEPQSHHISLFIHTVNFGARGMPGLGSGRVAVGPQCHGQGCYRAHWRSFWKAWGSNVWAANSFWHVLSIFPHMWNWDLIHSLRSKIRPS